MNITKNSKIKPDISAQSKSFLIISTNYQIETLYHILIKNPNLVNTKDQKNETFLSYAIKRKNLEVAELILTSPKLDYSYQDQNGNSYLHLAVINQMENIIRILIKKGINVNLQNNDGNTALHFAYSTGDIKFITIIIESKADFAIKNKNGLIAEEIAPGTFPEILDINDSVNNNNNINVTQNRNNTITINLNVDNDNNCKEKEKDKDKENNIIINDRGQINKSIKINWEENGISDNIYNNNANNPSNFKINNNINNNNNQFENTSKSKLKYSLVDFSYSEDGEEEENGVNPNKLSSSKKQNNNESDDNKNGKDVKSSDIFDLTSSLSYQEKVANASLINAHVVNEINIEKKESSDSGINDDIVNINKIRVAHNHPTPSLNKIAQNNFINNPIEMSQQSFQMTEENRKNMILSKESNENGNQIKSNNFKNEEIKKGNGQNINFDYNTSVKKEADNYDYDDNDILNKQDSGGICNYSNNNFNQSNTFKPQLELNQDFAFSPITTLKEPLNKNKSNGIEFNQYTPYNIKKQLNEMNNLNNNLNNLKNININNERSGFKRSKENKNNNFNINNNSFTTSLKRNNGIKEKNIINEDDNKNIYSNENLNQNYNIYSNLPPNDVNSNSNSKMDYNYQVNISKESISTSMNKYPRDQLYKFLSEIKMDKYYDIMNRNGFDDIQLLINQTKSITAISDKQLKEAGINLPGDRAKILIRLQEKAGNFIFPVPKEVYYICQSDNIKSDRNINKLNDWLKDLKIENYLEYFIKNGYHSIELLLLQMESKNPLTDEILKNELGINKIGHRSRIINKLIEEGKSLNNKLKTTMLIVGNAMSEKICDCIIF